MAPHSALLDLVEQIQSGDAAAQSALLRQLYPVVRKHLYFVLGNDPWFEDAVQESMLEIYRSLERFRYKVSVRAWALKIATRKARRYQRGHLRHSAALSYDGTAPEPPVEVDYDTRRDLARMQTHLNAIAPKKREAFVLMEILEMSAREAAEALGTFANTAASRCRHAREELQELFRIDEDRLATGGIP